MEEKRFDVFCICRGAEQLVAENMLIGDACILVRALLDEYPEDPDLAMQIRHRNGEETARPAGKAGG